MTHVDEALALVRSGLGPAATARRVGVSRSSVHRWLTDSEKAERARSLRRRKRDMASRMEDAIGRVRAGEPARAVARELDVSRSALDHVSRARPKKDRPPQPVLAPRSGYEAACLACGGCAIEAGLVANNVENECKHGRLPGDWSDPCGCFPQESASVIDLPARRELAA